MLRYLEKERLSNPDAATSGTTASKKKNKKKKKKATTASTNNANVSTDKSEANQ
jgi:hypothetical protein